MSVAAFLVVTVLVAVTMVVLGRRLGLAALFGGTRAFTALVDAWRFGGPAERDAAFHAIEQVFRADAPGLAPDERHRRRAAMLTAARRFDTLYGRFHWGVRVEALLADRYPLKKQGRPGDGPA